MAFRYLTAAEWGMTWVRPPLPETQLDPEVYVHHTAGSVPYNDAIKYLRWLNEYAQVSKGYSALDYDIMVHRDPVSGLVTIAEGRGKYLSAATLDRNEQGEAICLAGMFHPGKSYSRLPHPDEIEGIARGIVWGIENRWIAEDAQILGHRNNPAHVGATSCPGDYLYGHLPAIRTRVAELLNPSTGGSVNWNPDAATVAAIQAMPGVADTLAGTVNTWAVIGLIKAVQELKGLPVTGKPDQATWLAVNAVLAP